MVDWGTIASSLLAAGGGGAAVAYAIFKGLGAKWIDSRFANQLEKSRQDHATQTEHLRFRIAGLLDRATKLNQREFEVLTEVWAKTDRAFGTAIYLVSPFRTYPDFDRMQEAQFDEVIDSVDFPTFRKMELKAAPRTDRNSIYSETMRWLELDRAVTASIDFSNTLASNSIYLHPETYRRFAEFDRKLSLAVNDHKFKLQHPRQPGDSPLRKDDAEEFRQHGQGWFEELGAYLRDRLWIGDGVATD